MDFPFDPGGYAYRPLKDKSPEPPQRGWDVFALQTGYRRLSYQPACDGVFGSKTGAITWKFQKAAGLLEDGIAGIATQTRISQLVSTQASTVRHLQQRVYGQIEKECSHQLGNHTPPYVRPGSPVDGSRDRGLTMQNSYYHPGTQAAFDLRKAVPFLVASITKQHGAYRKQGVAEDRAWAAAQGHWNSPLYADRYAHGESVPDSFMEYLAAVTAYVT